MDFQLRPIPTFIGIFRIAESANTLVSPFFKEVVHSDNKLHKTTIKFYK